MRRESAGGTILVTGATGHLGANLVHRLIADGEAVRVLLREVSDNAAMDGLDVERRYGDLRDADAVTAAVNGCSRVYHTAAKVSTIYGNAAHKREVFDSNVIGTRNVLRAAQTHEVERVVVTGSFSALGSDLDHPERPVDETSVKYPFAREMPYSQTKVLVEHECLRAAAAGLPVIMATSTAIIGSHDYIPSRLGRSLCDFAEGRLRFIISGGHEFVAARDIVEGHLLAMTKGRPGQNYLFSSAFLSLEEILALFGEFCGDQPRWLKLPPALMLPIAEVVSFYVSRVHPDYPQRFTPGAIRRIRNFRRANIAKARDELGYEPTEIREALREAYEFHCSRGTIRRNPVSSTASSVDTASRVAIESEPGSR